MGEKGHTGVYLAHIVFWSVCIILIFYFTNFSYRKLKKHLKVFKIHTPKYLKIYQQNFFPSSSPISRSLASHQPTIVNQCQCRPTLSPLFFNFPFLFPFFSSSLFHVPPSSFLIPLILFPANLLSPATLPPLFSFPSLVIFGRATWRRVGDRVMGVEEVTGERRRGRRKGEK